MAERTKIIAGNWKMNCTVMETATLIPNLMDGKVPPEPVQVIVCPPFTALHAAANLLIGSHILLGAQDMSEHAKGAYTGEIAAEMLLTLNVSHVILGHSERRQYHAESDSLVNTKARAALNAGLTPIICVGETLKQREAGEMEAVVGRQIDGVLKGFDKKMLERSVIAYEPVWAIGTGKTASPEQAQDVHAFIRNRVAKIDQHAASVIPILYGGSVKPDNAEGLLGKPDIDGALVGGAALKAKDFQAIINAA